MTKRRLTVLTAFFLSITAASWAQAPAALMQFDGLPLNAAEADFTRSRPEAQLLKQQRDDKVTRYFLYQPKSLQAFGLPVVTAARGFETGRGCAIGLGLGELTPVQGQRLQAELNQAFPDKPSSRTDASGNQWTYFSSTELFVSMLVAPAAAEGGKQATSLSWSSRRCNADLAAVRWQTRPR